MAVVTPIGRPKSVRNRCLIEGFDGFCWLSIVFVLIFCRYRGFCQKTESDHFLLLCVQPLHLSKYLAILTIAEGWLLHVLDIG